MSNCDNDHITNQIDELASKIMEHVDSVRIFVTLHNGATENTAAYTAGKGNIYAQLRQVQEWLEMQDQLQRNKIKNDEQKD